MVRDVAGGHPFRVQTEHRIVEARQPPGVLGHDRRGERARPVPRHRDPHLTNVGADGLLAASVADVATTGALVPLMTEMLGQLDVEGGFQHLLGQTGQQPTRPGQLDPTRSSSRHQLVGKFGQIRCRRNGSRLVVLDLCSHA